MLPPPISTPTMDDNSNKTQRLFKQQQQPQQHINQLNQSGFFFNTSFKNDISTSSSSISTNSLSDVRLNASSIKDVFNKTLAKVTQTNFSDYTAAYSSTFDNSTLATSPNSYAIKAEVYDGLLNAPNASGNNSGVAEVSNAFDVYATAADMAVFSMSNGSHHLETTTTAFPTAQTVATFIAGNKNRATTIIVYPTVSPESIVIPIVSCIFGFPILAFIVICCLRHRAKVARERDRRQNYDMQDHAVGLVRFSPIHRLNYRSSRAISLRPERSLSQGFTSLELDTVVEERCSDVEQTQTEILHPESPMESSNTSCKISSSSS